MDWTNLLRAGRAVGAAILAAAIIPIVLVLVHAALCGPAPIPRHPVDGAPSIATVLLPTAREWWIIARTMSIACGAALPAMRGATAAAAGIVMLLALSDSTIVPLVPVAGWWPTEMISEVTRAAQYIHPTAYLLWRSWPMLIATGIASTIVWLGLRP